MQDKNINVSAEMLDHTKKYFQINGYEITASFTSERRPDTFQRVQNILLTSASTARTIDAA